jgi:hypothetical protein
MSDSECMLKTREQKYHRNILSQRSSTFEGGPVPSFSNQVKLS